MGECTRGRGDVAAPHRLTHALAPCFFLALALPRQISPLVRPDTRGRRWGPVYVRSVEAPMSVHGSPRPIGPVRRPFRVSAVTPEPARAYSGCTTNPEEERTPCSIP